MASGVKRRRHGRDPSPRVGLTNPVQTLKLTGGGKRGQETGEEGRVKRKRGLPLVRIKWVARTEEKETRRRKAADWVSSKATNFSKRGVRLSKSFLYTKEETDWEGPRGTPRIERSAR